MRKQLLPALVGTLLCIAQPLAAQTVSFTTAATGTTVGILNLERVAVFGPTGNFAQQTFNTGLPATVGGLSLGLSFQDQVTNTTGPLSFDVFLNGTNVGSFAVTTGGGFPSPTQLNSAYRLLSNPSFTFAPIGAIGGGYTVRIVQSSPSLGAGEGNLPLDLNGNVFNGANASTVTFTPSAVPEPATLGLVALGLVGVVATRRRRSA